MSPTLSSRPTPAKNHSYPTYHHTPNTSHSYLFPSKPPPTRSCTNCGLTHPSPTPHSTPHNCFFITIRRSGRPAQQLSGLPDAESYCVGVSHLPRARRLLRDKIWREFQGIKDDNESVRRQHVVANTIRHHSNNSIPSTSTTRHHSSNIRNPAKSNANTNAAPPTTTKGTLKATAPIPWLQWTAPNGAQGQTRNEQNFYAVWERHVDQGFRRPRPGFGDGDGGGAGLYVTSTLLGSKFDEVEDDGDQGVDDEELHHDDDKDDDDDEDSSLSSRPDTPLSSPGCFSISSDDARSVWSAGTGASQSSWSPRRDSRSGSRGDLGPRGDMGFRGELGSSAERKTDLGGWVWMMAKSQ